ncbi:Threonyl/alanyl tRNA synthetase, partial [Gigaspora rosea]
MLRFQYRSIFLSKKFACRLINQVNNMTTSINSTERIYYCDTYLNKLEAKIIEAGNDENGDFIIFDKTIFHPQGGGQPDDEGHFALEGIKFSVRKLWAPRNPEEVPYLIKHYYENNNSFNMKERINQTALQEINIDTRKLYARYHSAGHLLSNAVNKLYPDLDGCNGNHFPKTAFVIFEGKSLPNLQELKQKVNELVNELVKNNLPVEVNWNARPRTVQFGDLKPYPCGGTHVVNTSEIGEITIRNVKKGKGRLRVGYDI